MSWRGRGSPADVRAAPGSGPAAWTATFGDDQTRAPASVIWNCQACWLGDGDALGCFAESRRTWLWLTPTHVRKGSHLLLRRGGPCCPGFARRGRLCHRVWRQNIWAFGATDQGPEASLAAFPVQKDLTCEMGVTPSWCPLLAGLWGILRCSHKNCFASSQVPHKLLLPSWRAVSRAPVHPGGARSPAAAPGGWFCSRQPPVLVPSMVSCLSLPRR